MANAGEVLAKLAEKARDHETRHREQLEDLDLLDEEDHQLAGTVGLPIMPSTPRPPIVEGRVFDRLLSFHTHPPALQVQADAAAVYLLTPDIRNQVFPTGIFWKKPFRRPPLPYVKGDKLLLALYQYLSRVHARNATPDGAQQLAEALVLSGFITPMHEVDYEELLPTYVDDNNYYELVSPGAYPKSQDNEKFKKSVWGVTDGATRAGFVFSKPPASFVRRVFGGSLSHCSNGNEIIGTKTERRRYAVINKAKYQALYLFDNDVAREELTHLDLENALVQYERGATHSPLYHGLKLWNNDQIEFLDFLTKEEQDDWLLLLLDAGARYKEVHPELVRLASPSTSFYSLKDVEDTGQEYPMRLLRGHVVLIVNVANKDPEAALHYSELLEISEKYYSKGLRVLVFPCGQFGDLEFATDKEIRTYLKQIYDTFTKFFTIMTKGDVNGPKAREVFIFLNERLPGVFGPFVEWNFTKFLVDRNGIPFMRYKASIRPHVLEADLQKLLN